MTKLSRKISTSRALLEVLAGLNVRLVVTCPGTQIVPIIEAARQQESPKLIAATNELHGTFIALGIALANQQPGVVMSIPGPGFMYSLPAVAEADADSIPLLLIIIKPSAENSYALHNIDHKGIAQSLLRGHFYIHNSTDLATTITQALATTVSGEPGPVLVEIDDNVLREQVPEIDLASLVPVSPRDSTRIDSSAFTLRELLHQSQYPVFLLGRGAMNAADSLRRIIRSAKIPCLSTVSGRGIIRDEDPLCFSRDFSGGLGRYVPALIEQADSIFTFGAKLTHNGTAGFNLKLPTEKLVRVDCSEAVMHANYPASQTIVADCAELLGQLDRLLATENGLGAYRTSWSEESLQTFRRRREQEQIGILSDDPNPVSSCHLSTAELFATLQAALPTETLFVCDSGLHQSLARRHLKISQPNKLLVPADFQSMGFGIPAAIGAALTNRELPVTAIVGDGSFCSSGLELLTAVREDLSLLIVLIDDGVYGLIRKQLRNDCGSDFLMTTPRPDWKALTESMHAKFYDLASVDPAESIRQACVTPGVRLLRVPFAEPPTLCPGESSSSWGRLRWRFKQKLRKFHTS